ncbi:type VII secretion protein EccCa [Actinoalloteichus sp. AHMU CJ021]|nr:type VII secretion protein EccCa [Actinoalloteichus sp. AHMU CJ021]
MPGGELGLQEPPTVPEPQSGNMATVLTYLPMALGSGAMMLIFLQPNSSPLSYMAGGMMGIASIGMLVGQLARTASERKRQMHGERRDYLRYLSQVRKQVREKLAAQHRAATWTHPDPASLWSLILSYRLWERRTGHDDFGEVRLGLGSQHSAMKLIPPQTKPVEDLEPLSAHALRRFLRAYSTLSPSPIAVYLRGFARIQLRGDQAAGRDLVRAMLAQLAAFHSPNDLTIAVCAKGENLPEWDWVKWLPHAQDPDRRDALGPLRMVGQDFAELEERLGESFTARTKFETGTMITAGEPLVVIVVDGVEPPPGHQSVDTGYQNTVLIDVGGTLPWRPNRSVLHLEVSAEEIGRVSFDRTGKESSATLCAPDRMSVQAAAALARGMAHQRMSTSNDTSAPLSGDYELTTLLGVGDARTFDPTPVRLARSSRQRLRVPIGVAEDGTPVDLDIKESAESGMGPHGMLVGATGSGKSELLRTLVAALAITHSSEELNFVLVDFKGGAAFLGFDQLPHTSAVITNLVDELELVDRMADALTGEMTRRQELLRAAGNYASRRDYEQARRNGVPLEPLPALFVVVDEFSEMLVSKPDFIDVFATIGRLGRSLGVHLLLASQRLDEGRISKVETHLSYRIGLRTFSAMESRAVIGVPDAYELPTSPGNGYLRSDTHTLERFKGAYVSGAYRSSRRQHSRQVIEEQLHAFEAGYLAPKVRTERLVSEEELAAEREAGAKQAGLSVLDVLIDRLRGLGPRAHQVWLPPLRRSATLDELLPPLLEEPGRGLMVADPSLVRPLNAPMALVDLPEQQRRDLLTADLSGSAGHMAVVGGPQSGKSTVLRTVITGLSLMHDATEVQFYCLDFGGGTLSSLSGLPHVGSVANRLDRDRVSRTVMEMSALLERRELLFQANNIDSIANYRRARREGRLVEQDPYGDVFLVIDGWYTVRQEFEELEDRLGEIAARGLTFGIHLMVAATRWAEMRPWLRDVLGTRFELRLGDPVDSEIGGKIAAQVPAIPGRGITADAMHYLTALPRVDGRSSTDDLPDAALDLVDTFAMPGVPQAPPVRMLPATVSARDLPGPQADRPEAEVRVALGLDDVDLAPLWHDFDVTPHLLVFGDGETGKTNLLRHIARSVAAHHPAGEARIMFADFRRELYDAAPQEHQIAYSVTSDSFGENVGHVAELIKKRLPGPEITPDRLSKRDWWTGGRLFILVDDFELMGGGYGGSPLQPLLPMLPQAADIGLHVIIARSTAGANRAMSDPVVRQMWELGTPALMFSCPKDEGRFLGDLRPKTLPVGRAQHVNRRRAVRMVQTALLDDREQG